MTDIFIYVTLAFFVLPVFTYLMVRMGTYGYLKAKQRFTNESFQNRKDRNGHRS